MRRKLIQPGAFLIALTIGIAFGGAGRVFFTGRATPAYQPAHVNQGGLEMGFVYIGSASCVFSSVDGLPEMVDTLRARMREIAGERGAQFSSLGVALDWSVQNGIGHLMRFDEFDEISTGRRWSNLAAFKYVWEDVPGPPSTPQVVIVVRNMNVPRDGSGMGYRMRHERVLHRAVGLIEIMRLSEAPTAYLGDW